MTAPTSAATGGMIHVTDAGIAWHFSTLRRGISTGMCRGGLNHYQHFYNHRLRQFFPHERDFPGGSVPAYLMTAMLEAGISASDSTAMITSARMDWHAYACRTFDDLIVEGIATAGVEQTAARAGDPAYYYEKDGEYLPVGTINLMLSTNAALPDPILVKSCLTATEAKTAALQDTGVVSLQSGLSATGTGTDGLMIASDPAGPVRTDAGTHSKLGELIAVVVRDMLTFTFENYPAPWNAFISAQTPAPIAPAELENARHRYFNEKNR